MNIDYTCVYLLHQASFRKFVGGDGNLKDFWSDIQGYHSVHIGKQIPRGGGQNYSKRGVGECPSNEIL